MRPVELAKKIRGTTTQGASSTALSAAPSRKEEAWKLGYLGIDTSCYTTSVAYLSGEELVEKRTILTVPLGQTGASAV